MNAWKVIFYFLIGSVSSTNPNFPSIATKYGEIRGRYRLSATDKQYEAYEGIPFALPPTGERRFEPPEPISPWKGVLVANKFREACMGHEIERNENGSYVRGVEDCLYLNIYAPIKRQDRTSLPVIFWLYGGAFQYGTLSGNEAFFLVDNDIIFVTTNYRHGSLGFLSTEDEVIPGNMGLKDQALALRWISENIEKFGGNPKKITLAGISAGGASVHYHYLSSMSAGLFRSGISFSGTAFDSWTQTENSRGKALELGKLLNCSNESIQSMVECLKVRPADDIVAAQAKFMPWHLNEFTPFGPVVEKFSKNPFIDRTPIEIIRSGDVSNVPWITGVVSEEGLYPLAELATNITAFEDLNKNWNEIAPHLLQYYYTIPKEHHAKVAQKIRRNYFGDKPITHENILTMIHLFGDRIFVVDAEKAAREQALVNKNLVWFYFFSYRSNSSLSDSLSKTTENFGVSHADDILLVIGNRFINPTKNDDDFAMHKRMTEFWLSVARQGVPNFGSSWQPIHPTNPNLNFLHMASPDQINQEINDNLGQKQFWMTIDFVKNKIV